MSMQHDLKSVLMLTGSNAETLKKTEKITTVSGYGKGKYINRKEIGWRICMP